MNELEIESYGISITTLEEVFCAVNQEVRDEISDQDHLDLKKPLALKALNNTNDVSDLAQSAMDSESSIQEEKEANLM